MRRWLIGLAVMSAGAAPTPTEDPLTRAVGGDVTRRWLTAQPPIRVYGNTYLVGFTALNVGLIRTSAGLILIDAGLPQGVRAVEANIRALGSGLRDVRLILSTEPHYDHAGGLAALARDSGATVVASVAATPVLRAGRSGPEDPQMAWLPAYPGVPHVRAVHDGERMTLGDVTVTAIATPGHTPGSMSWTWDGCERGVCRHVVFASSLTPIAAGAYRFSAAEHRPALAAFRRTFTRLRGQPCDILLTPHPEQSGGGDKVARLRAGAAVNPFVDRGGCKTLADTFEPLLDKRLEDEAAGRIVG